MIPSRLSRPVVAAVVALLLALPVAAPAAVPSAPVVAAHHTAVERVISPKGIEVWLIRDDKTPVISLQWRFRGGSAIDPAGREGLAGLMCSLMDEGAGDLDSHAFQQQEQDNAIYLGCDSGRDGIVGSLLTLRDNRALAFDLAHLALTTPRFDADAIERMRADLLVMVRRERSDPGSIAGLVLNRTLFPDHPYGTPQHGTPESLAAITRDDLLAEVRRHFSRDRLIVTAAGAIAPDELAAAVDHIFGDLPATGEAGAEVPDVAPAGAGQVVLVPRPIPQTLIYLEESGLRRDDPDWYAATILNKVLGEGLGSRLMTEVREKRGLSYGVSSFLSPYDHTALFGVGGSTVNDKAGEAIAVIRQVLAEVARDGITPAELHDAQTYLTGAFPLQLTDTASIAGVLLSLRRDDLGIDYLDRRADLLNRVTVADVRRVAARLLHPDQMTTVLVGQPQGITPTGTPTGIPTGTPTGTVDEP